MSKRRGMIIKNVSEKPVKIRLTERILDFSPGDEKLVTAEEVRDPVLRQNLQVRSVAIVRPASEKEEEAFLKN